MHGVLPVQRVKYPFRRKSPAPPPPGLRRICAGKAYRTIKVTDPLYSPHPCIGSEISEKLPQLSLTQSGVLLNSVKRCTAPRTHHFPPCSGKAPGGFLWRSRAFFRIRRSDALRRVHIISRYAPEKRPAVFFGAVGRSSEFGEAMHCALIHIIAQV